MNNKLPYKVMRKDKATGKWSNVSEEELIKWFGDDLPADFQALERLPKYE